jgi:ABC-type molybdate transport system substrate-binding protein
MLFQVAARDAIWNTRDERKIDWRTLSCVPPVPGATAMRRRVGLGLLAVLVAGLCWAGARAAEPVAVPAGHEADLRFFEADGRQLDGAAAFARMAGAGLTVWVAGNQFFAMPRVIGDFQARHPGLTVGLMTLPPGLILQAIQAHGWSFGNAKLLLHPDVFATVSVAQLRDTGEIASYIVYMHNALGLLVGRGNPKQVHDLRDLTRTDLKVMLPNPLTEGIMAFYAKPILQRLGLWPALSDGADCADCDRAGHVHFTTVHHREIPAAIGAGTADVGLVWRTEALAARADGAPVDAVALPPGQDAAEQVRYVAGALQDSPHAEAASAYLAFLSSQAGQEAYAAYGFVPASQNERVRRPLPAN